jgi:hypothetical protein
MDTETGGGTNVRVLAAWGFHGQGNSRACKAYRALIHPKKVESITARWISQNGSALRSSLITHLASKLSVSNSIGAVEDHVHTFMTRMVEKDLLAPIIGRGTRPSFSVLRVWAYQSACTEMRRWGVDASTRTLRGAKTAREMEKGDKWRVVQHHSAAKEALSDLSENDRSYDLYDPAAPSPEDNVARKTRVDMVRRHLARIGQPHLVDAMNHVLNGGAVADLPSGIAAQLTTVLRDFRA